MYNRKNSRKKKPIKQEHICFVAEILEDRTQVRFKDIFLYANDSNPYLMMHLNSEFETLYRTSRNCQTEL